MALNMQNLGKAFGNENKRLIFEMVPNLPSVSMTSLLCQARDLVGPLPCLAGAHVRARRASPKLVSHIPVIFPGPRSQGDIPDLRAHFQTPHVT